MNLDWKTMSKLKRKPIWFEMVVDSIGEHPDLERARFSGKKLPKQALKILEKIAVVSGHITAANIIEAGPGSENINKKFAEKLSPGDIIKVTRFCVTPIPGAYFEIGCKGEIWDDKENHWNLAYFAGTEKWDNLIMSLKRKAMKRG